MDNNTQDISSLDTTQLQQVLQEIQCAIGTLEIQKQMHLQNYAIVGARYQELKSQQAKQVNINLPKLKKITLPKSNDEATYTLNKQ